MYERELCNLNRRIQNLFSTISQETITKNIIQKMNLKLTIRLSPNMKHLKWATPLFSIAIISNLSSSSIYDIEVKMHPDFFISAKTYGKKKNQQKQMLK